MKTKYITTTHTIGGYPCIRRKDPMGYNPVEYDYTMRGPRGDIWKQSPGHYKAGLLPGRWQGKVFKLLGLTQREASDEYEAIVSFPEAKLPEMVTLMQIPLKSQWQVYYADIWEIYWKEGSQGVTLHPLIELKSS